MNDDLHAEPVRDLVHDLYVTRGVFSQTVVDVMGDYVTAGIDREHEQGERIGTARHRASKGCARAGKRAPPYQLEGDLVRPCPKRARHADSSAGPRRRDTQRSGARISAALGRFPGACHASERSSGPPAFSISRTKRAPSAY